MEFLLLLFVLVPAPEPSAKAMMVFSRFARGAGKEISLVDKDGTVREGRLVSATADAVTMEFASGRRTFAKADVTSADRLRDSNTDGLIRGAVFGGVLGLIVFGAYDANPRGGVWLQVMGTYGAIGWTIDALNKNRQPIYRAPAPAQAKPGLTFSLRF